MRTALITILTIGTLQAFGQLGSIDGTVIYKPDSSKLSGIAMIISGTRVGAMTDTTGYFVIDSLAAGTYDLTMQGIGMGKDTIRNVSVKSNTVTTLSLAMPTKDCLGMQPKRCPIDNNRNGIIPIVYGLPGNKLMRRAEKGKIWLGGCIITGCDPAWYCKRHNHTF